MITNLLRRKKNKRKWKYNQNEKKRKQNMRTQNENKVNYHTFIETNKILIAIRLGYYCQSRSNYFGRNQVVIVAKAISIGYDQVVVAIKLLLPVEIMLFSLVVIYCLWLQLVMMRLFSSTASNLLLLVGISCNQIVIVDHNYYHWS